MLGEKGTLLVEAKTTAAARSGKTFESFKASAVLMQGTDAVTGTTNAKEFDVLNLQTSDVNVGDLLIITKTIQGFFVTVTSPGGGAGSVIRFTFDEDDYNDDVPADCTDRIASGYSMRALVTGLPCGGSVDGMDDEGYVTLSDPVGWLDGLDYRELPGRSGYATRIVSEEEYAECGWEIVSLNIYREVSVVHNIIFREMGITIKRKRIKVLDECDLPDEEIEGVDCEDEDYPT